MTDLEQQPHSNGIEENTEDDSSKARPADIEAVTFI